MNKTKIIPGVLFVLLFITFSLQAQNTDYKLDRAEQKKTIDSIRVRLNTNYVFPDVATEMTDLIVKNFESGEYEAVTDPVEFANRLTEDLRSVSNDLHLSVQYAADRIARQQQAVTDDQRDAWEEEYQENMRRNNYGFKEIKILTGNIGYLNLTGFSPAEFGGETASSAMNFLSNTDALIIDLRRNGGGSPTMIQLISSYLFDAEPVHLNNFYYRPENENYQTWTLPHVPGKRNPDAEVYVLTSRSTFSAAEEFSYNLKNLERATLIGEATGGGAHPGGSQIVTDKYMVWIPTGRAINPITNTNWEGVGVKPHIEVTAEEALLVAQVEALKALKEKDPERERYFDWQITGLKAQMKAVSLSEEDMRAYTGTYGDRVISLEEGRLYYRRGNRSKYELTPMGGHWFMLEDLDYFRIEFEMEDGAAAVLVGHYDNGSSDRDEKK
ncbi:S41 family peptidase [Balneola sp. MJW-20]|uniref:S41 family peptidase n=1 Tax=Gracilimonas aurantiaca TaxID=3234185 RepID=UPI0034660599